MPEKVEIVTTLQQMVADFTELEKRPGYKEFTRLEERLARAFEASQGVVHVLSGGLRTSGIPHSSYDGDVWTGGIDYARNPGIFELALGDEPSLNHPEGEHGAYLTTAVDPYANQIGEVIDEMMTDCLGSPDGGV